MVRLYAAAYKKAQDARAGHDQRNDIKNTGPRDDSRKRQSRGPQASKSERGETGKRSSFGSCP